MSTLDLESKLRLANFNQSSMDISADLATSERASASKDQTTILPTAKFKFTDAMKLLVDLRRFTCPKCFQPAVDPKLCPNDKCMQLYCKDCADKEP